MLRRLLRQILLFLGYIFHHNNKSKIVYYHDVSREFTDMGTDFDLICQHFKIIRDSGYEFTSTIKKINGEVMICFDDGWAGIYNYKDYFVENNIFPTIFIAVDLIDSEGHLSKGQIEELKSLGFKFQAHTWSHQDLTTFDDSGLEHELKDSKNKLETMFNQPFNAICFPMGRFSDRVIEKCHEYKYNQLYSSLPGGYYDLIKKGLICRNCAQNSSSSELSWMLNGTSMIFRKKLFGQHYQK